ncbi:MAG TPA: lipid-A-disaccharide synthase [Xanthomonadaceae bacterium]|nr:lipid-A-disaccharide synthase [Xanthomonadaceae bacterium]
MNAATGRGAPRIALVAGEASGDQLGAGLIVQLRQRYPDALFAGIGGAQMRAAGLDAWHDCSKLAVMGLAEVVCSLPRLLRLRAGLRRRVLQWSPDVFVGIDAPDFNLGVERWMKRRGIPTIHYVSPSIWAWREGRAVTMRDSADQVLCLFPMEPAIYARHSMPATFVGHPLADAMPMQPDRAAARRTLGLSDAAPVLAVLPGSRLGEIARLGALFLQAASMVAAQVPGLQMVVPAADAQCRQALQSLIDNAAVPLPDTRLIDGEARTAIVASDVVLMASGTATLEAMLAKRPMVVGYRLAPLTHFIVKRLGLLKVERYALPNVLAGETLVPELMQDDCTADALAAAVLRWLSDPAAVAAVLPRFEQLHAQLRRDASACAANAVVEVIRARRAAPAVS